MKDLIFDLFQQVNGQVTRAAHHWVEDKPNEEEVHQPLTPET